MKALKIMIVDDDEADRKNFIRMLEQTSMQADVTEAENAADAYEKMLQTEFDCILMDYWMPGEDGITGLKKILERFPFAPVIMLTVESGLPTVVNALKTGAVDYISKDEANRGSIQRAIENAVEKSEIRKLAEDNRQDLIRFADMMVHDMKSPIGHLASFVDLMLRDIRDGKFDRISDFSSHIQSSSDKLIEFLNALTKYTNGNQSIDLEPVDLKSEINAVLVMLDDVIKNKNTSIEIGELHDVMGHGPFISQLLQNLIANVLKFTDKDEPTIRIETECSGDIVILKVSDNGIGIPKHAHKKIFHPFNRMHSKHDYPGIGLGLATCERIVERHGGRIWCESVEGEGATFLSEFQAVGPVK